MSASRFVRSTGVYITRLDVYYTLGRGQTDNPGKPAPTRLIHNLWIPQR